MEKFEQYKLNISEKDKILVMNYLEKLKNLIKKHTNFLTLYIFFCKISHIVTFETGP